MVIIVIKAGKASLTSLRSNFFTESNMSTPTSTNAPLVAAPGMRRKIGERNNDSRKRSPTNADVTPLRPPSAMPEALSISVSYTHLTLPTTF